MAAKPKGPMKGRHHLATHALLFFAIAALIVLSGKSIQFFSFLFHTYLGETVLIVGIGIILYFIGAVLPDADSNDRGSYIFYSRFFLIGWIVRLLEFPLSLALGREVRHRQSLHTFLGILTSSVIVVIAISLLYYWLISDVFYLRVPLFWFFSLLIGQLLHLIEDWHFHFR